MATFIEICDIFCRRESERYVEAAEHLVADYADELDTESTAQLARALAKSGGEIVIPESISPLVDVPSTGGPASLSTLLCPLLLAADSVFVPKVSATGSVAGAIDTMGIIPGFKTELTAEEFVAALSSTRIAHTVQSSAFCPADRAVIAVRRRRGKMRHPQLAAASLLAKKLAVPRTVGMFDFRIGAAGNIADSLDESKHIAGFFTAVAERLELKVGVAFTRADEFACSALGRLESLSLLNDILSSRQIFDLDRDHACACCVIADAARRLALTDSDDAVPSAVNALTSGKAKLAFVRHLEAQGSSEEQLTKAIEYRARQRRFSVFSPVAGFWIAPNVDNVKRWFKGRQAEISRANVNSPIDGEFGVRFKVRSGDEVEVGQEIAEVRLPSKANWNIDASILLGDFSSKRVDVPSEVLEIIAN